MEKLWICESDHWALQFFIEFFPNLSLGNNINRIETIAHTADLCSLYVYLLVLESYVSFYYATMLKYKY